MELFGVNFPISSRFLCVKASLAFLPCFVFTGDNIRDIYFEKKHKNTSHIFDMVFSHGVASSNENNNIKKKSTNKRN